VRRRVRVDAVRRGLDVVAGERGMLDGDTVVLAVMDVLLSRSLLNESVKTPES